MAKSITSTFLLMCFSIAACAPVPNSKPSSGGNNGSQTKPGGENMKSYRFKPEAEQCDTYNRSFDTQKELCYAVQIDELNNEGCAATQRREYFDKNCSSLTTFDPVKAKEAIINVNGKFVDCTYSETDLPEIRQYTARSKLYMEHTRTRAEVWHELKDMKIVLHMILYDGKTGRKLKDVERHFEDETEPVVLTSPASTGSAVLTCLVNLADNPNRN